MPEQKKILVIGYNPFSKEGANGRTLEFLTGAYNKSNLAQIFFSPEKPDFEVCDNFYNITETELLKGVVQKAFVGHCVSPISHAQNTLDAKKTGGPWKTVSQMAKKYKRTTAMKFLRGYLWKKGERYWACPQLYSWIECFHPDVVLTISGKNSCFHKIAVNIAQKYNLPLVVYHCEDYCFKTEKKHTFLYQKYIRELKQSVDELMGYASLAIYNSNAIRKLYQKEYDTPSIVAYMSTDFKPISTKRDWHKEHIVASYMGNLGLGRCRSLIDIAKAMEEIDTSAVLNVYAPLIPEENRKEILEQKNVVYKGFVDYAKCRKVMEESNILVHAESFMPEAVKELRIAFSTKIADSLASGVPFFVYAPAGIASTDYLIEEHAACVACHQEELLPKLKEIFFQEKARDGYVKRALETKEKNHDFQKTVTMIEKNIAAICEGFGDNDA